MAMTNTFKEHLQRAIFDTFSPAKFHNHGILGIPGVRAVSQFLRCFPLSMVLSVRDAQHQTQCDLGLDQEEEEELRSPEMNPPSGRQPAALTDGATAPQTSSS